MESYINFGAGGCPKQVTKIPNQKSEPIFVTGQLSGEIFQQLSTEINRQKYFDINVRVEIIRQKYFDTNVWVEIFRQKFFDRNIWEEIFRQNFFDKNLLTKDSTFFLHQIANKNF